MADNMKEDVAKRLRDDAEATASEMPGTPVITSYGQLTERQISWAEAEAKKEAEFYGSPFFRAFSGGDL